MPSSATLASPAPRRSASIRLVRWILGGLLAGALVATAPAQDLALTTHTQSDGLSNLSVTAMVQLPDGRLVIGTENGLYRHDGARITLITNDHARPAIAIADLYKARWQIELLFRWIKQHLKLKTFLGRSDNAVRLQLFAAMIAFLLLRLAAMAARSALPPLRFADLVRDALFVRKPLDRIDKPPQLNPSKSLPRPHPNQLTFCYA